MKFYSEGWKFNWHDLWMGAYWEYKHDSGKNPFQPNWLTVYICPIPTVVYKFKLRW